MHDTHQLSRLIVCNVSDQVCCDVLVCLGGSKPKVDSAVAGVWDGVTSPLQQPQWLSDRVAYLRFVLGKSWMI